MCELRPCNVLHQPVRRPIQLRTIISPCVAHVDTDFFQVEDWGMTAIVFYFFSPLQGSPPPLPPLSSSNHYWPVCVACRARRLKHHMAQEMIQTEGLQSSLFAYNALISGCASGRGYDRAIGYFNEMVSRPAILLVRNEDRCFCIPPAMAVGRGTFGRVGLLLGNILRILHVAEDFDLQHVRPVERTAGA